METAADHVVHAAGGHLVERLHDHLESVASPRAQQELER
jgi:hypothetical protein